MPILIIKDWQVSIRPCELNNFAAILGNRITIQSGGKEYQNLMRFLTATKLDLVEVIDLADVDYLEFKERIMDGGRAHQFLDVLDKCRELTKGQKSGSNVLRYLLYRLNNIIIKQQYKRDTCRLLSDLHLEYGCIPFDTMPFTTSLKGHNPRIWDVLNCIDPVDREHEFFSKLIHNNTETKRQLYTPKKEICVEEVDTLTARYNSLVYDKHYNRRLESYKEHIYIKGYEADTVKIIEQLKTLSSSGIASYSNSVKYWLDTSGYEIDCPEKRNAIVRAFEDSKVVLIYGAAGTGKSTMINHISNFFSDKNKLYLAVTNPAVDNLKRRVKAANCTFKTITKFLTTDDFYKYDLVVIDECSTVSNRDMVQILEKASFKLLVLVGDVFQIESITFGNWFDIARSFISEKSIFELTKPYRSSNNKLLTLWDKVRNLDDDILEHIAKNNFSVTLDESILEHTGEDEIVLCLNYNGLYGINNLNRFLQKNNRNPEVAWGIHKYKVADPVVFNEYERFYPAVYNNLKGWIVDISLFDDYIVFDIEIDKVINELDAERCNLQLVGNSDTGNSIIRFSINKYGNTDEDDDTSFDTIVPFQVAYAVSIHKAQGLEYRSVKIVITDEVEDMITHNVFYTAITRAKESLKIYWTPETENKVLGSFEEKKIQRDIALLSQKYRI